MRALNERDVDTSPEISLNTLADLGPGLPGLHGSGTDMSVRTHPRLALLH